jgi:hypothetical protein
MNQDWLTAVLLCTAPLSKRMTCSWPNAWRTGPCAKVEPSHRHTVNLTGGSLSYSYQVLLLQSTGSRKNSPLLHTGVTYSYIRTNTPECICSPPHAYSWEVVISQANVQLLSNCFEGLHYWFQTIISNFILHNTQRPPALILEILVPVQVEIRLIVFVQCTQRPFKSSQGSQTVCLSRGPRTPPLVWNIRTHWPENRLYSLATAQYTYIKRSPGWCCVILNCSKLDISTTKIFTVKARESCVAYDLHCCQVLARSLTRNLTS